MSTAEKKPVTSPAQPPPQAQQQPPQAQPTKKPLVSRRTFLLATIGASTALAAASMASSGAILEPLIPAKKGPQTIANAQDLENEYAATTDNSRFASRFFYWPYEESVSPYYKNVLLRLPDELVPDPGPTPSINHFAAWNITCVHLRCIVNPGYNSSAGEYRLLCPCHGSQYRFTDAVPVAGPAYDLGLRPLPRIRLRMGPNNDIVAEELDGEPGVGRTD